MLMKDELGFVVHNENEITPELDAKIRENLCIAFPHSAWYFKDARGWKGAFPSWSVIGFDSVNNPVVHCGVVERVVTIESRPYRVFGIQNVYVLEPYRGRGLAKKLITMVVEEANRRTLDYGLLFARPHVAKLYTDLGWELVDTKVVLQKAEDRKEFIREFEHDALYYKSMRNEKIPAGTIYFNGPDW